MANGVQDGLEDKGATMGRGATFGKGGAERDEPGGAAFLPSLMAGPFLAMLDGPMRQMVEMQTGASQAMFDAFLNFGKTPPADAAGEGGTRADDQPASAGDRHHWQEVANRLNDMWRTLLQDNPVLASAGVGDSARWFDLAGQWLRQWPMGGDESQTRFFTDSLALWEAMLVQAGPGRGEGMDGGGSGASGGKPGLPRQDRRFRDARWQDQPAFAMLHQMYLLMSEQVLAAADQASGLPAGRKDQLKFFTRLFTEAMSPAHFPLTNPLVIQKTIETGGDNLIRGMEHFIADLEAGKLTHTDNTAFVLGENIAATPGKVIHEEPLFQIIQYAPTTETVLTTPLVIFPPWINRFYILDLGPKNSFVKWAVDQGLTVCMVSWKSADASMAEVAWDDYIAAQMTAIDIVRERFAVPSVHTIGYCVGGTTLAATLSVMARRGEAEKVASATYFTAQIDFTEAGELRAFIDEQQMAMIDSLAGDGFVDGRYLALAFNLLRSPDLIWNYVINNYLLGEDYKAFDLLHWNGDTTNLPARFHREYLKNLYHDNLLVVPDALSACGTPIDLQRNATPAYIQAGVEDHIAPLNSVWKLTRHLAGPQRFVLAGSGHIAGVINPPSSGKYQYWTIGEPDAADQRPPETLDLFRAAAVETKGSWWPDWIRWIEAFDGTRVKAGGKRKPGGRGDTTIEDAPGRYVRTR